jgi:hypothetical protein
MRYLIYDQIGKRFRTNLGWITKDELLLKSEHLLAFNNREHCDEYIKKTQTINAVSFGISSTSHLYKLSHIIYG